MRRSTTLPEALDTWILQELGRSSLATQQALKLEIHRTWSGEEDAEGLSLVEIQIPHKPRMLPKDREVIVAQQVWRLGVTGNDFHPNRVNDVALLRLRAQLKWNQAKFDAVQNPSERKIDPMLLRCREEGEDVNVVRDWVNHRSQSSSVNASTVAKGEARNVQYTVSSKSSWVQLPGLSPIIAR